MVKNLSIKDALVPFDTIEQKHFQRAEILDAICRVSAEQWNSEPTQYEYLAFCMVAGTGKDCWGTYYGPFAKDRRKDNTELVCTPDRKEVTASAIEYWERRARTVVNPMLKLRYTGLVLDFKESVTGIKPDFTSIRRANIVATLEVAEDCNPVFAYDNLEYCIHALDMAVSIGNNELIERGANALAINYKALSISECFIPSVKLFKEIVKHRIYYPELMTYAVNLLNAEFDNRELRAQKEGITTDEHGHIMKSIAELLCEYNKTIKQPQSNLMILKRTTNAIRLSFGLRGGLWAQGMMEEMQKMYRAHHLYREADLLYKDIIEQGVKAKGESQQFFYDVPISSELWERHWNSELQGTDEEVILHFMFRYLPNVEAESKKVNEEMAFRLGMRVSVSDSNGIPISYVGTGKKTDEQKLSYQIYSQMKITNAFLNEHINRLKDKGLLTVGYLLDNLFKDSVFLREEQYPILKRGLEAFIEKDYLVACHLLIPQFESAVRMICKLNGGDILRPKNNPVDGNEYKSLEGLLSQECVSKVLGNDITTYFRVLFTDSNGGNLRNNVTHGLLEASAFNENMANRIFHAFIILSLVKPIDNNAVGTTE